MKTLFAALLWSAAAVLALMLLLRLWRGRNIVLSRRCPRLFAMAVFLLVLAGVGAERIDAGDEETTLREEYDRLLERLPDLLKNEAFVRAWRNNDGQLKASESELQVVNNIPFFRNLKSFHALPAGDSPERDGLIESIPGMIPFPAETHEVVKPILESMLRDQEQPALPPDKALAALDAVERAGQLSSPQIQFFWSALPGVIRADREGALAVATRLRREARMQSALIAASFGMRPYLERAWASKAGTTDYNSTPEKETLNIGRILGALPYEYDRRDAGLWTREARAQLTLRSTATVTLELGESVRVVGPDENFEVDRLSALRVKQAAVVEHEWIGRMELPADSLLYVFDLPGLLDEAATARVKETVAAALDGDEAAAAKIERSLPFTHAVLREQLKANPAAKGAPLCRTLLELFE